MNALRKLLLVLALGGTAALVEAQPPREGPGRGGPEVKKEGPKGERGDRGPEAKGKGPKGDRDERGPEAKDQGPKKDRGDRGPEARPNQRPEGRPEVNRARELEAKLDMLRRATQEVEAELRRTRELAEQRRPESAPMPKAKGPEAHRGEMPKGPPFGGPRGFGGGFGGRGGFGGGFPPFGGPPGFGAGRPGQPGQPPMPQGDRAEPRRQEPTPERRPEAGPPPMMREVLERLERIERELEAIRRELRSRR